ncbi:MAG TPA: hydrogenase expression/formation protein HupK [Paracoccaceae bacterium]|nr:hydrogenase expression/formation protein HupK [Paracoccaceae bacterium]
MRSRLVITLRERDGRFAPDLILPQPLTTEAMLLGLTPDHAVEMLGRLFNLCRHAQEAAARLALGLPAMEGAPCRNEILRDSVFRLFMALPAAMGQAAVPLPKGWQAEPAVLAPAMFGPTGRLPQTARAFQAWLKGGAGMAPVVAAVADQFAPGEAASRSLPFASEKAEPCENSATMRHADHPVMDAIERDTGRNPLWRTVARLLDIEACLDKRLPSPQLIAPGLAEAHATRGLYRIGLRVTGGRVSAVNRRTPTDDICHPDGPLLSALAALPVSKRHLAPLVVECFDPCLPWHVREKQDA